MVMPAMMSPEEYARYYPNLGEPTPQSSWRGWIPEGVPSVPDMNSPIFSPPASTEGLMRDPTGGSWVRPEMLEPTAAYQDQLNAVMLKMQDGTMDEAEGEALLEQMLRVKALERPLDVQEQGLLSMVVGRIQARNVTTPTYSAPPAYTPPEYNYQQSSYSTPSYPTYSAPRYSGSYNGTKLYTNQSYPPLSSTSTGARPQSSIPGYISNPATALAAASKAGQLNTSIAPTIGNTQSNLFDLVRRMNASRKGVLGPRQQ